jgi:hypothetical protein
MNNPEYGTPDLLPGLPRYGPPDNPSRIGYQGQGMTDPHLVHFYVINQLERQHQSDIERARHRETRINTVPSPTFDESFFHGPVYAEWVRQNEISKMEEVAKTRELDEFMQSKDPVQFELHERQRLADWEKGAPWRLKRKETREAVEAIHGRHYENGRLQTSLVEYEKETRRLTDKLERTRLVDMRIKEKAYLKAIKVNTTRTNQVAKHNAFVTHAMQTFLTAQRHRQHRNPTTSVKEPMMDEEDNTELSNLLHHKSSTICYYNYTRKTANSRNLLREFGAYNNAAQVPLMKPLLVERQARVQEKRIQYVEKTDLEGFINKHLGVLDPNGGLLTEGGQGDIIDIWEKMMATIVTIETDDVVLALKWMETVALDTHRDLNQEYPAFSYVKNVPTTLKEICYLVRITFLSDKKGDGVNTAEFVHVFVRYIREMLAYADFCTFMNEPVGGEWSTKAFSPDSDIDSDDEGDTTATDSKHQTSRDRFMKSIDDKQKAVTDIENKQKAASDLLKEKMEQKLKNRATKNKRNSLLSPKARKGPVP